MRGQDGMLAGSALTMIEAVRNLHAFGATLEQALTAAAAVPARIAGRDDLGTLAPGFAADVVVLDDRLEVRQVLVAGELCVARQLTLTPFTDAGADLPRTASQRTAGGVELQCEIGGRPRVVGGSADRDARSRHDRRRHPAPARRRPWGAGRARLGARRPHGRRRRAVGPGGRAGRRAGGLGCHGRGRGVRARGGRVPPASASGSPGCRRARCYRSRSRTAAGPGTTTPCRTPRSWPGSRSLADSFKSAGRGRTYRPAHDRSPGTRRR